MLDKAAFLSNSATGGEGGNGASYFIPPSEQNGYTVGGYAKGYDGGERRRCRGAILNVGSVSGNYWSYGNTAAAGAGGAKGFGNGPGDFGVPGSAGISSPGLLNVGSGTGSLVLVRWAR